MKILQINKFYFLKGGCERYVFNLEKALVESGHEVIQFAMQDSRNEPSRLSPLFAERVRVDRFSLRDVIKFFYNYDATRRLEKIIKAERPDIAHLHNIAHQLSPSIIRVLKRHGIPVVQTLHDYKLVCPNYRLFTRGKVCQDCAGHRYYNCLSKRCVKDSYAKSLLAMLEAYWHNVVRRSYDKVDLFIAPSEYMKSVCVHAGVPSSRIVVVNNFVPRETICLVREMPRDYLLYFGRISEEKGLSLLLDAMNLLSGDEKLKIVGTGPDYQVIAQKIRKLNLGKKVEMVGPKNGRDLIDYILDSRAVVVPSIWPENYPYSILESLVLGRPIVASRTGGLPEMVADGVNGYLFESGDKQDLARRISKIFANNTENIDRGARLSAERYSARKHSSEIVRLYRQLIKRTSAN